MSAVRGNNSVSKQFAIPTVGRVPHSNILDFWTGHYYISQAWNFHDIGLIINLYITDAGWTGLKWIRSHLSIIKVRCRCKRKEYKLGKNLNKANIYKVNCVPGPNASFQIFSVSNVYESCSLIIVIYTSSKQCYLVYNLLNKYVKWQSK